MTKAAVHDTQQSHSICENQRRCRDRAGRLDLARSFPRAGRPPLKSHRRPAGRPMVLECTIHARRQRRKRWKRIYTDGARGAGSLRGALTGNDVRLIWRLAKTRLLAVAQVPKNTTAPWLSRLNGRRGNGNGLGWRPRSTIRPNLDATAPGPVSNRSRGVLFNSSRRSRETVRSRVVGNT